MAILTGGTAAHAPSRFDFLHDFAMEAGVGFLFPPVLRAPAGTEPDFTAIQGRATAMTPVLEGILKDIYARPRWRDRA